MRGVMIAWACILALSSTGHAQDDAGRIRLKLEHDTVISGIACGASGGTRAAVYRTGVLASCPLARDTLLFGHAFRAGTWLILTEAGELEAAWLSENTRLQGHGCRGTGYQGWSVQFYSNGALRLCYLADEEVIDGVPCRKASFLGELLANSQVTFHRDGRLAGCSAARAFHRDGVQFSKRERVHLDPDGRLIKATS